MMNEKFPKYDPSINDQPMVTKNEVADVCCRVQQNPEPRRG